MKAILQQTNYEFIRHLMQPGDDIMFGGVGPVSDLIRIATMSPVTHIGSVYQTWDDLEGTKRVRVIESTSLDGVSGVVTPFLSDRLKGYKGNIWWCPLSKLVREHFDEDLFFKFMFDQEGKEYDTPQAIKSALDLVPLLDENKEDFDKLFCSELRTAGLEVATKGMIESLKAINASECTPKDCYQQGIHTHTYYQICGDPQRIPGFN